MIVVAAVLLVALAQASRAAAWGWPVEGPVLRPFVAEDDPYAGGQHRGIDIGAPSGAEVRAPATGVVSFAGQLPREGRCLTIRTEDGYSITLVHLGAIAVPRRDSGRRGRGRGDDRPERRAGRPRAVRPSRRPPDRRAERVRRPALAAPCSSVGVRASAARRASASGRRSMLRRPRRSPPSGRSPLSASAAGPRDRRRARWRAAELARGRRLPGSPQRRRRPADAGFEPGRCVRAR